MSVEFSIISIGALSHNLLWGESVATRTAHATTTLVEHEGRRILVDPGLPGQVLEALFPERTGRTLSDVTDVFCTTLQRAHCRGIASLSHAAWWASAPEIEYRRQVLAESLSSASRLSAEDADTLQSELKLLDRFRPAADAFSSQVGLYPLIGATPGSTGLILTPPTQTIIIAGDAVLTAGHLLAGQIWQGAADREAAMDCLSDVLEVADLIVPGHDNWLISPRRWM